MSSELSALRKTNAYVRWRFLTTLFAKIIVLRLPKVKATRYSKFTLAEDMSHLLYNEPVLKALQTL